VNICPIILNYNTYLESIECVKSILSGSKIPSLIFIVDNNSSDDSEKNIIHYLASISQTIAVDTIFVGIKSSYCFKLASTTIYLIGAESNEGYACGNLLGVTFAEALTTDIDYYWMLNSDTRLKFESFFNLNKYLHSNQEFELLGTVLLDQDGNTIQSCGGNFSFLNGRAYHLMEGMPIESINSEYDISWATYPVGASMVVSKNLTKRTDWIREDLFLYYEEINIVIKRGKPYRVPIITNVLVEHKCGASTGFSHEPISRPPQLEYYLYRNKLLTAYSLGVPFVISYLFFSIVGLVIKLPKYSGPQARYAVLGIINGLLRRSGRTLEINHH